MDIIASKIQKRNIEPPPAELPPRRGSLRGRGVSLEGEFKLSEAQQSCRELLRELLKAQKIFDKQLEGLVLQHAGMQRCRDKEDFRRLRGHLVARCSNMEKSYLITDQARIMEEALKGCNQFHRTTYGGMICRMMGEVRKRGMKFVWIALPPEGPGAVNSVGEVHRIKFEGNRLACLSLS